MDANDEPKSMKFTSPTLGPRMALENFFAPDALRTSSSKSSHTTSSSQSKGTSSHSSGSKRSSLKRDHTDPVGISPTDSHPHRARTKSPQSLSALLWFTTERLNQETARANTAENQNAELLARIRNLLEARGRSEIDLAKVREELGLYKIQLDLAQKEIFRAQEIVNKVERQRVEAEERSQRDRNKARKVLEQRAVEQALEEGRQRGFREGLERGRLMAESTAARSDNRYTERPKLRARAPRRYTPVSEEGEEEMSPHLAVSHSSHSSSSHDTQERRSLPDVARFQEPLPVPTVTTPTPIHIPSTQPQQIPPRPQSVPNPAPSRSPEDIAIHMGSSTDLLSGDIHPIPVHNRSPSVLHQPINLPPDGFIPTMGADSRISLPPPHELGTLISPTSERGNDEDNNIVDSNGPKARDYASDARVAQRRDTFNGRRSTRRRTMSTASAGSTSISQYDLVSAPPPVSNERESRQRSQSDAGGLSVQTNTRSQGRTQPEKIAEEWRAVNGGTVAPEPRYGSGTRETDNIKGGSSTGQIRRPATTQPDSNAQTRNGSRKPREIVLPMPLAGALLSPSRVPKPGKPTDGAYRYPQSRDEEDGTSQIAPPRPNTLARTVSNVTIPNIDVEPPSQSPTNASEGERDPVLLTPEHANIPLAPPSEHTEYQRPVGYDTGRAQEDGNVTIVLPDNHLPAGFVPLSPIPTLSNWTNGYNQNIDRRQTQSRASGSQGRASPRPSYATAPIPDGLVYPDPPMSRPSTTAHATSSPDSKDSVRMKQSGFSPAPLERPLSLFSDS